MKRLCFLSPDLNHARKVVADLRKNGIPEKHIYTVAKEGINTEGLPDAGPVGDDFLEGYKRGAVFGATAGFLLGLLALAFPPASLTVGGPLIVLLTLAGAGISALLTAVAGSAFPSSRLQEFDPAIEQGQILVLADVPKKRVADIEAMVKALDPEVEVEGTEPPTKLIP